MLAGGLGKVWCIVFFMALYTSIKRLPSTVLKREPFRVLSVLVCFVRSELFDPVSLGYYQLDRFKSGVAVIFLFAFGELAVGHEQGSGLF